jgi:hypothetical protein
MIQKQSVEFQGHTLEIQPAPPRNMVLLDDVPQSLHLDTVMYAMDNYGIVTDIWPSCQPGQVVVFFENEQGVLILLLLQLPGRNFYSISLVNFCVVNR